MWYNICGMKELLLMQLIALLGGVILDLIFGDPHGFPHIVVLFGKIISGSEKLFYRLKNKFIGGIIFAFFNLLMCTIFVGGILTGCFLVNKYLFMVVEMFLIYQCLAITSLKKESKKVYSSLAVDDIEGSRNELSMIVGRDTDVLSRNGIVKAAVETVAENTSDGIICPLIYIMLFGALGGCVYKMINTMDSMVGYKNARYEKFGTCAARLDDVFGFIPSRVSAITMICGTHLCGFDAKNALKIWRRDRRKHASPNSAQTESVMAGALNIRLAGDASYKGVIHKKPFIGDDIKAITDEDILRAHKLMYATAFINIFIVILIRCLIYFLSFCG